MKKNITKRLLAALLATALAFSLTACGGGNDAAGGGETSESGETASAALTEEEYQQAVEKFSADMSELQTSANEAVSDPESAIAILDEMKVSINEFASVTPPEVYADAHEMCIRDRIWCVRPVSSSHSTSDSLPWLASVR